MGRGELRKAAPDASPGQPPGNSASTDGRHVPTGRQPWLWLAMAVVGFGPAGVAVTHTQPVLVQIAAGVLSSAAWLESGGGGRERSCLAWGPGGLAYRRGRRSGALRWRDLTVGIWQGCVVEIFGIPWSASVM